MRLWLLLGAAVAVLGLCAGVGWKAYQAGGNAVRVEMQEQIDAERAEAAKADERYAETVKERNDALTAYAWLLNQPPPNPQILVKEVPGNAPNTVCADRSDEFFRLYNAAATGARPSEPAPAMP